MNHKPIYIGKSKVHFENKEAKGAFVNIDKELYYKIEDSDTLRPFFMSIVSDSNHWLFISSNGGLSAGRKNSDSALFPYYTDDKIMESAEITGSKAILQIHRNNKTFLWEPFSNKYEGVYSIHRNLYKNSFGNSVIFEETNVDLGLTFRYQWNSSHRFGFVRKAALINNSKKRISLTVLDGIQNILPNGLGADLQNTRSNLADAYKKNELAALVGLGIYSLSAIIVDKAEPSEALKATIAWSIGLENPNHLISSLQLNNFRKGQAISLETAVRAEKGAYFVSAQIDLKADSEKTWLIVADVDQGPADVVEIAEKLKSPKILLQEVIDDIELGTQNLIRLVAAADGLQLTNNPLQDTRHFSNVLFNIMRGGIFDDNYQIPAADFVHYIQNANKRVYQQNQNLLALLVGSFSLQELRKITAQSTDSDFKRLCFEYLPLKFSRRHGDPSRPWNKFSINVSNKLDSSRVLNYEGNWRDIFQNWEALALSYPEFIDSMIHKFLNASTFDGYNPYRVTKDGFDWEVIDPNDPWSFIGYWGDHQTVYLLKLLEIAENHFPEKLSAYFEQDIFVYANVPYQIKSYSDILKNPKDTILFDQQLDQEIQRRKKELGADGALLTDQNNSICKANLIEKLMATTLAKCSNFVPEAGIWMNTQRPEWNDANNALVGNGVSMVTLYYLRRFIHFFKQIFVRSAKAEIAIAEELFAFFNEIVFVLSQSQNLLSDKISDKERRNTMNGLGNAGGNFRTKIYQNKFSGTKKYIAKSELLHFFEISLKYINHTIKANKRSDNLYHSYNLMTIENESEISIAHLPEMLEGQVAVLSSAYCSSVESLSILYTLKNSKLYRDDQKAYVLYPNKQLPEFLNKNIIPKKDVEKSVLLNQFVKDGNTQIIEHDISGNFHFNGNFNNADSLKTALSTITESKYQALIEKEREVVLSIFESVFKHKTFTGRSGTFFGYEGLGSIYWHMVSKLVLAAQESCFQAAEKEDDRIIKNALINQYYEIKEGIGLTKSPKLYGAFPSDPYSHTPAGRGAQQPGMTGQVKEDIVSRFGELGVIVRNGKLRFHPFLLKKEEFLEENARFRYIDVQNHEKEIVVEKKSLCFTYCQLPIVYKIAKNDELKIIFNEKKTVHLNGLELDEKTSKLVFARTGELMQIQVSFNIKNF